MILFLAQYAAMTCDGPLAIPFKYEADQDALSIGSDLLHTLRPEEKDGFLGELATGF
jgi:hypothetical protein